MLFYLAFHIKEDMLSTLCTGIMGIVGLLMVHQTSLPMNKLRKAMLVGLCIAFVVCYFFLPELFTLSALDKPSLLSSSCWACLRSRSCLSARRGRARQRRGWAREFSRTGKKDKNPQILEPAGKTGWLRLFYIKENAYALSCE